MAEKKKWDLILRYTIAAAVARQLDNMLMENFGIGAAYVAAYVPDGTIVLSFYRRDNSPAVYLLQENGDFYFNTGRLERIYLSSISEDEPVEYFVRFLINALEYEQAKT